MTKKDFILIANALRYSRPHMSQDTLSAMEAWRNCVTNIMEALRSSNPRFDSTKFLDYINR
jgi:hypothetical protein